MTEPQPLSIHGHNGESLSNQYWPAVRNNGWLAVILPGLGYSMDMPLLFFTRELLLWRGVDVLNLNPETRSDEFQAGTEEEQLSWLHADVKAGIQVGIEQKTYSGLILAGKSIGSLAIATIGNSFEKRVDTAWVWITPLLRWDVVIQSAMNVTGHQVFLCGRSDSTFNSSKMEKILAQRPLASAYVAEDANHSLEVPGDEEKTFAGISGAMTFLGKYLDSFLPVTRSEGAKR